MSNDWILFFQLKKKVRCLLWSWKALRCCCWDKCGHTRDTQSNKHSVFFSFLKQVKESSHGKNKTRHFPLLVKEEDGSQKWEEKKRESRSEEVQRSTQEISNFKAQTHVNKSQQINETSGMDHGLHLNCCFSGCWRDFKIWGKQLKAEKTLRFPEGRNTVKLFKLSLFSLHGLRGCKSFSPQEGQVINHRRPKLGSHSFYWVTDAGTIRAQVAAVLPKAICTAPPSASAPCPHYHTVTSFLTHREMSSLNRLIWRCNGSGIKPFLCTCQSEDYESLWACRENERFATWNIQPPKIIQLNTHSETHSL